jgi:hypothetical protein
MELPVIVERFALGFDDLPIGIEGVPASRILIISSRVVRAVAVQGLLAVDGGIDLIGVDIEL